jgi:hypothetical protein
VEQGVAGVEVASGGGFTRMEDAWRTWITSMFEWVENQQKYQEKHLLEDWDATK